MVKNNIDRVRLDGQKWWPNNLSELNEGIPSTWSFMLQSLIFPFLDLNEMKKTAWSGRFGGVAGFLCIFTVAFDRLFEVR